MKAKTDTLGKNSLFFVVDEAVHLLREIPGSMLALYFAGSVPFVLGALYFWSEMSRSASAPLFAGAASLALAFLFLWMKFWHAIFCVRLRAHVAREAPPVWTPRRLWNLLLVQAALQPSRYLVLPAALGLMLPFGWVHAFYENVTVIGDGRSPQLGPVVRRAWKLALLWPKANHILIWMLSPFLLVFAVGLAMSISYLMPMLNPDMTMAPDHLLFSMALILLLFIMPLSPLGTIVLANIIAVCWLVPHLLRMLFGIETLFTISGTHFFNTTFVATACALTFLCLDPLLKAAHVLRCFYGDCLATGDDLRIALKTAQTGARGSAT